MSWMYVPAAVSEAGPRVTSACARSVTSSETRPASKSSLRGCATEASTKPLCGMTSRPSTGDPGVDAWMASLAASPVSRGPWPVRDSEKPTSAIFGPISSGSFARWDPGLPLLRMSPDSCHPAEVLAYAAGLMDGEGCITIPESKGKQSCHYYTAIDITLAVPGLQTLEWMQKHFGGKVTPRREATGKWQETHSWRIFGDDATEFLRSIFPYLLIKRRHAIVALRLAQMIGPRPSEDGRRTWTEEMRAEGKRLRLRLQELNRRGPREYSPLTEMDDAGCVEGRWVTPQMRLDGTSEPYSETWPRAGIVVNGRAYPLAPLAPLTGGIASGLWPTPATRDHHAQGANLNTKARSASLATVVQKRPDLWPTPRANDDNRSPEAYQAMIDGRGRTVVSSLQVAAKMWPTPMVGDATGGRTSNGKDRPDECGLRMEAMRREKWPTPTTADGLRGPDYARSNREGSGGGDLVTAANRETFPTPSASMETAQDMEQARFAGTDPRRPAYSEVFPTPRSEDSECAGAHRGVPDTLTAHARLFPTPTVQDAENCGGPSQDARNTRPLNAEVGGGLNPTWTEWLMGWPPEWTNPRCSLLTTEPDTWAQEPAGLPRLAPRSMPASERRSRLSILGNGWVPQVAMVVFARIVAGCAGRA